MTTFEGMVSFRCVISEGKSHFLAFCQKHSDGAIDSRPQVGAWEPGEVGRGGPNVLFHSSPQSPCRVPMSSPKDQEEEVVYNCQKPGWIDPKAGQWMKPAMLNEKRNSTSVCSVTV